MDDKPYMTAEEFASILQELGQDEVSFRDKYDAVFHLVTAANGALPFYTTANNTARTETPEEAIDLDEKTLAAWAGHPHLRIIDNSTDFNGKMLRLLKEVMAALGEPEPMEHARRFLIKYPDLDWLNNNPNCQRVEIIQTYLTPYRDEERRICMRGTGGSYIYYKTTQRDAPDGGRMEVEERLSQEEYFSLLMEADPACRPIRKTRYCLVDDVQSFEVDLYPTWKDVAMLQIELSDPDAEVHIPENLHVIREVTDNPAYDNHEMARL
jgi:CYTH domain-containing protein